MTELVGHIGGVITIAKGLLETSRAYNDAAFMKQISDLTIQLAILQTEAAQMMTELQTLRFEAEEQEKNPLRYTGVVYRDTEDHPYCPACYDSKRKRIHIPKTGTFIIACPVCKTGFNEQLERSKSKLVR